MNETEIARRTRAVAEANKIQELGHPASDTESESLKFGIGQIDTNETGGEYTITEQWWGGSSWADATAPAGLVGVTAEDISALDDGAVGDFVIFWQQRAKDGTLATFMMQKIVGIPPGGDQYEVLQKDSGTDYDVVWDYVRGHA